MSKDQDLYREINSEHSKTVDPSLQNESQEITQTRVEITEDVAHKQEADGETGIYLKDKKIGRIKSQGQQHMYEMAEGFELENEKIFKKEKTVQQQPKAYVEGCDMGWC
ncbi:DUF2553 family protein [Evansella sp. AB-rgal1]|uniref:DUF2553 family protein n=1 Tax=Evansella sp. AB-rgal1 TaxID=3242696 RepID=UPI00359D452F